MSDNLEKAKLLLNGNVTCSACKEDVVYVSNERGVKPLVMWLDEKVCLKDFSAADKVVGRATAFLYVLLGVKELYASVISSPALCVLRQYGIKVEYGTVVDSIMNRRGDGNCPFESAVLDIDDPNTAFKVICDKLTEFSKII